jgi:hypothetical protein
MSLSTKKRRKAKTDESPNSSKASVIPFPEREKVGDGSGGGGEGVQQGGVEIPTLASVITDDILRRSLEVMVPIEIIDGGDYSQAVDMRTGARYSAHMHASLVRFKMLGMSNASCAKAVGMAPETLNKWCIAFPKLGFDLEQATELSKAYAAVLLREMMKGKDVTAFNAIKLWLQSIAPEFRSRAEVGIVSVDIKTVEDIKGKIYGIFDNDDNGEGAYPALPARNELLEGPVQVESVVEVETDRGDVHGDP